MLVAKVLVVLLLLLMGLFLLVVVSWCCCWLRAGANLVVEVNMVSPSSATHVVVGLQLLSLSLKQPS